MSDLKEIFTEVTGQEEVETKQEQNNKNRVVPDEDINISDGLEGHEIPDENLY